MRVNAQEYAEKWARRAGAAQQDYVSGVQRVSTPPGQQAAAQKQAYLTNVQAAGDRWAAKVGAVSLNDWQTAAIGKGASRYSQGVQAAAPKVQAMAANLLQNIATVQSRVKAMPGVTLEQRIQRSVVFATEMAKTKGR